MHAECHRLLTEAGPFVRPALLATAMHHELTVEVLVQRALGRELPHAPPELVAKVDGAVAALPTAILHQAIEETQRQPFGLPTRLKEASEEHRAAAAEHLRTAFEGLAAAWPPPQSYGPPAPVGVEEAPPSTQPAERLAAAAPPG